MLIPELLVESYHSSLRRVAALSESVANTSRMVERVAAVIDSRHAMLSASVQAYMERRDKIFAGAVAIGSLLALPPTLLLAYFGTNSPCFNGSSARRECGSHRAIARCRRRCYTGCQGTCSSACTRSSCRTPRCGGTVI